MPSKKRSKKDNNHNEIVNFLKTVVPTSDCSWVGHGWPDGMCRINGGWQFFDVKNPETHYGRKGLNKLQREAATIIGATVYILRSIEDAENFAMGRFDQVDQFPSAKMKADQI